MIFSLLLSTLISFSLFSATPIIIDNSLTFKEAVDYLPHCGEVSQTEQGFVYLKVSDSYICLLEPLLEKEFPDRQIFFPPDFGEGLIGAHITLMDKAEGQQISLEEIGEKKYFSLLHLAYVEPENNKMIKRVYYLAVNSPFFASFRKKYHLQETLNQQEFHITIAVEYEKNFFSNWPNPEP